MERFKIGEVVKPQGIKGEVKLRFKGAENIDIMNLKTLRLGGEPVTVNSFRVDGEFVVIKFNEINSRNDAEKNRGKFLEVEIEELNNNISEDEYLIEELIGMECVFDTGEAAGTLSDIENFGSADVFYLDLGGKEVLFPYVDDVITNIDKSSRRITINKKRFLEVSV